MDLELAIVVLFFTLLALGGFGAILSHRHTKAVQRYSDLFKKHQKIVSRVSDLLYLQGDVAFSHVIYAALHRRIARSLVCMHEISHHLRMPSHEKKKIEHSIRQHNHCAESLLDENQSLPSEPPAWVEKKERLSQMRSIAFRMTRVLRRLQMDGHFSHNASLEHEIVRMESLLLWCDTIELKTKADDAYSRGNYQGTKTLLLQVKDIEQHAPSLFSHWWSDVLIDCDLMLDAIITSTQFTTDESASSDGLERFWQTEKSKRHTHSQITRSTNL